MPSQEPFETWYARLREISEREDIVTFINSCFAATGQSEYCCGSRSQTISIAFLHQYVLTNYRTVYARSLAAGINHYNQALIIFNLLKGGTPTDPAARSEEDKLIQAVLHQLPPNRVYHLFTKLASERINNRRVRATMQQYIDSRPDLPFHIIKYRNKFRLFARHAHLRLNKETGDLLFRLPSRKHFDTPLYATFLQAHYSKQAIYDLPYTIAEGMASKHGIPREEFLRHIVPRLTLSERLRLQNASQSKQGTSIAVDLASAPLTKLAIYVLSLPIEERIARAEELDQALLSAAQRALQRFPFQLSKVALVLDRSRSSWGSREKRRRPLAVAVAVDYLMRFGAHHFRSFWTPTHEVTSRLADAEAEQKSEEDIPMYPFLFRAAGQSDLATPLLQALRWGPDQVILVSDGYENGPIDAANQIATCYNEQLAPRPEYRSIDFIHANPVFDADHIMPKRLGNSIVTVGLRDAEDLGPALTFAKFGSGGANQEELELLLRELAMKQIQA